MSDNNAHTLDGRPGEPLPEGWGRPAPSRVGRVGQWSSGRSSPGIATLGDMRREEERPRSPQREGAELYTGGERSGLAVQNPNERGGDQGARGMVQGILQQALTSSSSGAATPDHDHWSGVGHTLGSDEEASRVVGEPAPREEDVQRRTLTFWRDGFSIEDGPLHAYDAPGTKELLEAIHAGRAPLSLFNVQFDQPLELVVQQRTDEAYVPQPRASTPFSGEGQRLGSVVPTISGANSPVNRSTTQSPAPPSAAASPAPSTPRGIDLDPSKPATNVQIRLADGSRVVARINLDGTVADLRAFVNETRPDSREFILQTTFPSRELRDDETIEGAKLQNAVVVQRYK